MTDDQLKKLQELIETMGFKASAFVLCKPDGEGTSIVTAKMSCDELQAIGLFEIGKKQLMEEK